jgi:hypothetical protein
LWTLNSKIPCPTLPLIFIVYDAERARSLCIEKWCWVDKERDFQTPLVVVFRKRKYLRRAEEFWGATWSLPLVACVTFHTVSCKIRFFALALTFIIAA